MRKIRTNGRAVKPQPWIILLLTLVACLLTLTALTQEITSEEAPQKDNERALAEEVELLKERQDLLVEAAQRDLGRAYFVFSIVAVFFALFTAYIAARQMASDRRRQRIEDQHLLEMQTTMNSFRENITTINSLISALRQTFDVQTDLSEKMKDVDRKIVALDEFKKKEQLGYKSEVDKMNATSARLFVELGLHRRDRGSFKHEENKVKLGALAGHFDTLAHTGEISGLASPVSLFLRSLAHFNSTEYEESSHLLREARDYAKRQLESPLSQFGTWDIDEVGRNLRVLITETNYHLGILYYNLGEFEEAREEFSDAFEHNPLDFRSRIYVPELMFFYDLTDPKQAEQEFRDAEMELNNVTTDKRKQMNPSWNKHFASLKMRQGNFYLKKLFPISSRAHWQKFENEEKSLECFWSAKEHDPDSAFVSFSLAQSMHVLGRSSLWRSETPEGLFLETLHRFRDDAITKTEPILLSLLHYSAAICCWLGNIEREDPRIYLNQARQHLQRVPRGIRVFSPISKINLQRKQILREMQLVEDSM